MNAISFGRGTALSFGGGTAVRKRPRAVADDSSSAEQPPDAAWIVMEAANDLGDHATVEACRRVIDANLNGTPVSHADLNVVTDYFR
jgi:hypothetical protein